MQEEGMKETVVEDTKQIEHLTSNTKQTEQKPN